MVRNVVFSRSAQLLDESRNPLVFHDVGRFSNDGTDIRRKIPYLCLHCYRWPIDGVNIILVLWTVGTALNIVRRSADVELQSYRFTAILIVLLTQSASRHRVLSAFVHSLTGFSLTDVIDLEEKEVPLTNDIVQHIQNYCGQVSDADRLFGKLGGMCNILLCLDVPIPNLLGKDLSYIFDALMRWRIGSQHTTICIEGDMHQTIAAGMVT